jgi:hypothetical protein
MDTAYFGLEGESDCGRWAGRCGEGGGRDLFEDVWHFGNPMTELAHGRNSVRCLRRESSLPCEVGLVTWLSPVCSESIMLCRRVLPRFVLLWLQNRNEQCILLDTWHFSFFGTEIMSYSLIWDFTQRRMLVSYRHFGATYWFFFQEQTFEKKSVRNYHSTLRKIPKESSSHLHLVGSPKSRILKYC